MRRRCHPFDVVGRVLAERLHRYGPSSDELLDIVRGGVDWEAVVGHASRQYILPALAASLRDLDLIGSLDEELGAFLLAVRAANVERNDELRDQLATAVGVLNRAGIEPVLLKGAIRLVDGPYPDHGWRMMRDLDLLVPGDLATAIGALERAGYERLGLGGNELGRRGNLAQIDLHQEAFVAPGQARLLRAAEIVSESRPAAFRGGTVRLPTIEHQLVHLIGHCQVRHLGHALGRIAWHDRLEAAALVRWTPEGIDWQAVSARFVATGYRRHLSTFLLSLQDGSLCAPMPGWIDLPILLQQRRIALQARSTILGYVGSRAGWWASLIWSQMAKCDGGERRAATNLKRLTSEPGALRRIARAFMDRWWHLAYGLPYLAWLGPP